MIVTGLVARYRRLLTSVVGTSEALSEDAGVLVKLGNVEEICDKVLESCKNPERRKELGKIARDLVVARYSWSVLTKDLSTLIMMTIMKKEN